MLYPNDFVILASKVLKNSQETLTIGNEACINIDTNQLDQFPFRLDTRQYFPQEILVFDEL